MNFSGTKKYEKEYLNHIAFPLGGIGAGMICLEGTGTISHVSIKNKPDVFNEPMIFSAVTIKDKKKVSSLVLESQMLQRKIFGHPGSGNGGARRSHGLPRFDESSFRYKFPFCEVSLKDGSIPLKISVVGWSPFIPLDSDSSSLPVAALEYKFRNTSKRKIDVVYSFNAMNFIAAKDGKASVGKFPGGLVFSEDGTDETPWDKGSFCVRTDNEDVLVNPAWFRGGWFDSLTMIWKDIADGRFKEADELKDGDPSPGGSIFVPLILKPGEEKTVKVMFSWYFPESELRFGKDPGTEKCTCSTSKKDLRKETRYIPWYAGKFKKVEDIAGYWKKNYNILKEKSLLFSNTLYKSSFPEEIVEAVSANLTILKSPTVLRQLDGRIWAWEGCCDTSGCCAGTCTHVWNYAQAMPHLFPELERTLRQTEFNENQDDKGHQVFRAALPIRSVAHDSHAAADGQLGGIMKIYREWRISGDTAWLEKMWAKMKKSLDYCIETWDPEHDGVLSEPHHNTYDIEFWGANGMCSSFYLGALKAASLIAQELKEDFSFYKDLYEKGRGYLEGKLFNGEYFEQKIQWKGLKAENPVEFKSLCGNNYYSAEAIKVLEKEGPKYQYGKGCLSDGVLGAWMAEVCGVGEILDGKKVKKHLLSVYRYNFRKDLSKHANPQRPLYAIGKEGGLLLCTWPKGEKLSLPFPYSEEVFTGIEYHVASHLMMFGCVKEALDIVKTARKRYDGRVRNPFNEYECGHWYARAMSSYALMQGMTGIRYDAVEKTLYIKPAFKGDFQSFICTETGYGITGIRKGKPFIRSVSGKIECREIVCL